MLFAKQKTITKNGVKEEMKKESAKLKMNYLAGEESRTMELRAVQVTKPNWEVIDGNIWYCESRIGGALHTSNTFYYFPDARTAVKKYAEWMLELLKRGGKTIILVNMEFAP